MIETLQLEDVHEKPDKAILIGELGSDLMAAISHLVNIPATYDGAESADEDIAIHETVEEIRRLYSHIDFIVVRNYSLY